MEKDTYLNFQFFQHTANESHLMARIFTLSIHMYCLCQIFVFVSFIVFICTFFCATLPVTHCFSHFFFFSRNECILKRIYFFNGHFQHCTSRQSCSSVILKWVSLIVLEIRFLSFSKTSDNNKTLNFHINHDARFTVFFVFFNHNTVCFFKIFIYCHNIFSCFMTLLITS